MSDLFINITPIRNYLVPVGVVGEPPFLGGCSIWEAPRASVKIDYKYETISQTMIGTLYSYPSRFCSYGAQIDMLNSPEEKADFGLDEEVGNELVGIMVARIPDAKGRKPIVTAIAALLATFSTDEPKHPDDVYRIREEHGLITRYYPDS